ncbi:glycosyltransferase [Herbiconiux daphne]|uniref:Glycosyltransferase n=1 Tax=Herbiconiux daphne TaxID=2970914 RepID=A0ABT2H4Q0_9MICO|nr:glycosyltransferase [Herbiconiux daphne]MCS5734909.1 glycosyltransferase [Herbiconiux daphne]
MTELVSPAVSAVVTAFRPGERLVPLVRSLVAQTARVVVVDDGSGPASDAVLQAATDAGAEVVRHAANRGIAAALNTGVRTVLAAEPRPAFVLTFDQDSRIADDVVAALVATAGDAAGAGLRVGMVAPVHVEGLPSPVTGYSRGFMLGGTPIQSGLLIPAPTFDRVGLFAEPLFIDGVDTDFALRAARLGLVVVLAPGATLGHSLGDRFTPTLLGRPLVLGGAPVALVVSKPFRYYYLLRNRILLNRRHARGNRAWCVRETLADLRHCLVVLAVAPGRAARLRAMAAGVRDGWAGRTGRIPGSLERRLAGR